ncbi:MAG: ABC transporter substrate-binding protein [Akkermansiaceae bacterium]
MDLLATVGAGVSLTSLVSCGSESTEETSSPSETSDETTGTEASDPSGEDLSETVRIGYLPITDSVPLILAHALGYFEEEGLKTEKPTLIRGWSPLVEAFIANKVNLAHFLIPIPLWMRYNNDVKVKVMSWAHTNGSAIVVGKHTGAKDFKDLGGMQIAVPYWYSMHNIVLQMGLREAGLKAVIQDQTAPLAADEVNLMVMPPPEMPAALAAKKIDAFTVAEPFNALGELKAGGQVMRFTGDIWKNHPCCVVCLNEEKTVTNPVWTQKVMNAVVRANVYASQNKEKVAEILAKEGKGYLPMPAAVIKRAMTHYGDDAYLETGANRNAKEWKNGRIDFQPWPYPSATKFMVESMNKTLVAGDKSFLDGLDKDFVAKDLVDYDFVGKSCEKYPEWKNDPSVNPSDPYAREETISI